jgi:putative ABC transport system ATP-binding protein
MSGDGPLLTGRGLHKSFGPTPALRGMDLSVDAGEVLAVMGPSGSGKSTLLHCLAGILTPDSGEVTFDGRRVVGLDGLGHRLPGELTGGQGQRAAIARALIAGPRLVFADEPTGSLDSVAADEVMELLVTTAKDERLGIVVVTHEPRVAAYADRRVTVRDGRAVQPAAVP